MAQANDMDQTWSMDDLDKLFQATIREEGDRKGGAPDALQEFPEKLMREMAKEFGKTLMLKAPKMLAERRKQESGFQARNFRRWREAFDLIEIIWVCCEEIGRNFNQHFRPEAVKAEDFVFEALTAIHAKSLLVVSEMICLMKGGFPDAALTRWRTLYELNVVATLILREGPELALRYLAHADVQAARGIEPDDLIDPQIQDIRSRSEYAISRFGEELTRRYGWACAVVRKKRPTFEDIERLAERTDGRAMYKHASLHIHSNHRAYDQLLGVSENEHTVLLVGSSNSGMVGPLTLASLTLVETTSLYLLSRPNVDRAIFALVLQGMSNRMGKLAGRIEARTLKAARRRRASAQQRSGG